MPQLGHFEEPTPSPSAGSAGRQAQYLSPLSHRLFRLPHPDPSFLCPGAQFKGSCITEACHNPPPKAPQRYGLEHLRGIPPVASSYCHRACDRPGHNPRFPRSSQRSKIPAGNMVGSSGPPPRKVPPALQQYAAATSRKQPSQPRFPSSCRRALLHMFLFTALLSQA